VPQFITFTADDAVQLYTVNTINSFLGQRKNPNGCTPGMTYFVSLNYTNYSMVTDLYVAGNEIADHTVRQPSASNRALPVTLTVLSS
jgi:peptidoglycan/xylan/chitin deacetylase (PgdA/CDA1 family)